MSTRDTEVLPAYISERGNGKSRGAGYVRVRCPHCRVRHWVRQAAQGSCPRTGRPFRITIRPRVYDPWEGLR